MVRLNRVTKESVCLLSTIQAFLRRTLNELQVLHLLAQVLSFLLRGIHQTVRSFHVDVKDLLLPIDILTDCFKVMFRLTASKRSFTLNMRFGYTKMIGTLQKKTQKL